MRILYVVTSASFGGAPLHVLQLIQNMVNQGHEVGLVAAPEPRLMKEIEKLNVKMFPNIHFVRPLNPWRDIKAIWPVIQAIRSFNPDIIHAHSTKAGLAARFASFIFHKPVIFTAHGWIFSEKGGVGKRYLLIMLEWLAAKVTSKIICVSHFDRDLAIKYKIAPPEKLVVIHNGIEPAAFFDNNRDRQSNTSNILRLVMVGRLDPPKDPITLLQALKHIKINYKLLLVGDGELRRTVEDYVVANHLEKRVFLMGERKDISKILSVSDIFILSSSKEGFPYTIIEAMMAGLPVIATSVGGVPEMVEDGVTGLLVNSGDILGLKNALITLFSDELLRNKMGEAGQKKALEEFTLNRMLRETQYVYDEVLDHRGELQTHIISS